MRSNTMYSISQVSENTGLKPHTLRFYEKEGILHPKRTEGGIRYYVQEDLNQLFMICCLKKTGMPLRDIKTYFDLVQHGDSTLKERVQMFEQQKIHVLSEIEELKRHLETVNYKINFYKSRLAEIAE